MENKIHLDSWVSLSLSPSISLVGTVKYLGETKFASGFWAGVLLVPEYRKFAKNNGSVQGVVYFTNEESPSNNLAVNDGGEGDAGHNNHLFGLFVRPDRLSPLQLHDILENKSLSMKTKEDLVSTSINNLYNQLLDTQSNLEVLHVEYEHIFSNYNVLTERLNHLEIHENALESLKHDQDLTSDKLEMRQLELKLIDANKRFTEKEVFYLKTIDSLKKDLSSLQLKISRNGLNESLISDLNKSERIIENLTFQNNDLIDNVSHLKTKAEELEEVVNQNKDLIRCYEQTEIELNQLVLDLNKKLEFKDQLILQLNSQLDDSAHLISKLSSKYTSGKNSLCNSLYSSLLLSTEQIVQELVLTNPEYGDLLEFYCVLIQVKNFVKILSSHTNSTQWLKLFAQLDLMLATIPHDKMKYALKYENQLKKIQNLVLDFLETEDKDEEFLLSYSINFSLDINEYLTTEHFEAKLINRELLIYYYSTETSDIDTLNRLKELRPFFGLDVDVEEFTNSPHLIDPVKLDDPIVWEIASTDGPNKVMFDNSQVEKLKLKINLLQSKLSDDRELQKIILKLEKSISEKEKHEAQLRLKFSDMVSIKDALQSKVEELTNRLMKFGLEDSSLSSIDEFNVLNNLKLIKTIENQRKLIEKVSNPSPFKAQLPQISIPQPHKVTNPSDCLERINKLFELTLAPLSPSPDSISHQHEKLLEYLYLH